MIFSRCVLAILIGTLLAGCGYQLRVAGETRNYPALALRQ